MSMLRSRFTLSPTERVPKLLRSRVSCMAVTVEKGSVTVNGVSLTVCNSQDNSFQVAIIPYTYEHTNFHQIEEGSIVNLEFDIIGKYISRIMHFEKD